jgi:hypothetical protein
MNHIDEQVRMWWTGAAWLFTAVVVLILSMLTGSTTSPAEAEELQPVVVKAKKLDGETNSLKTYKNRTEPLSDKELVELLTLVGFEGKSLKTAWAVVKRESNGRPLAHNGNRSTGDNSYGLFQINMIGNLGEDRREKFDLKSNEELFDPVKNAQAAFYMTAGGTDWSSWDLGPNAYNGGATKRAYLEWLAKYPE